jgi:hypothetical protein
VTQRGEDQCAKGEEGNLELSLGADLPECSDMV